MPALIETPAGLPASAVLVGIGSAAIDGCRVLEYTFHLPLGLGAVVGIVHRGQAAGAGSCRLFRSPYANARMAARVARQQFRAERRRRFREEARRYRQLDELAAGREALERSQLLEMMLSCTSCTPELCSRVDELAQDLALLGSPSNAAPYA